MFLLWFRKLPWCEDRTPASVVPPTVDRSSFTNTPCFPPSSFILPCFVWFYIFFSTGQVVLSALSWCSACTSVSEGVVLMYPWREIHSMSTYSSAILLSLKFYFIFNWRIITLQYCVSFCQTSAWLSYRYIYVPSLLNLPPWCGPYLMSLLDLSQYLSFPFYVLVIWLWAMWDLFPDQRLKRHPVHWKAKSWRLTTRKVPLEDVSM